MTILTVDSSFCLFSLDNTGQEPKYVVLKRNICLKIVPMSFEKVSEHKKNIRNRGLGSFYFPNLYFRQINSLQYIFISLHNMFRTQALITCCIQLESLANISPPSQKVKVKYQPRTNCTIGIQKSGPWTNFC